MYRNVMYRSKMNDDLSESIINKNEQNRDDVIISCTNIAIYDFSVDQNNLSYDGSIFLTTSIYVSHFLLVTQQQVKCSDWNHF